MKSLSPLLPENLPWLEISIAVLGVLFAYLVARSTILRRDDEAPIDYAVPLPEQCKPGWSSRILEHPSIKIPGSSAIQCYNPATGQLLGQVNPATPDGIDRAVARAAEGQKEWAKTTFRQRRKVLRTILKFILDNQEDIATVACLDSGKTKVDAMLGEILVTVEKLKWTIQHGENALRPERRPSNFLMMYKQNEVRWEPLGVLAACVSWNYPFHNALSPIISTLFTGSALLVKSSEQTAFSATYFTSVARNALSACGHSSNLIQSIVCWPQTANHLTSHPGISHITFIGSRPIAHIVCASAAKALIPICVELGGKDPALVLDSISDYDLEHKVVPILMKGTFVSSGQNCIGIERIIACPRSYDRLIPFLEKQIRSLRIGSSLPSPNSPRKEEEDINNDIDIGAMISPTSFPRLTSLIQSAVSAGATLHCGGKPYTHPSYPSGHYFSPTFLSGITNDMAIAQTELFAPICLLLRATSTTHAIEIANSTSYALGASVFGNAISDSNDINICVDEIKAGMVSVNDFGAYYAVGLPFGGRGGSGGGDEDSGAFGLCKGEGGAAREENEVFEGDDGGGVCGRVEEESKGVVGDGEECCR
ncbi:MAG: hypothetical protein Q9178_007546 [Gyalolechia marmorata]